MVKHHAYRVWDMLVEGGWLLIIFAPIGLIWANVHHGSYEWLHHFVLAENPFVGHLHVDEYGHTTRILTLHYLANDVLMAFFFFVAGKEVFEAAWLKDGSLRGKQAVTPIFATIGGVLGPIGVYLGGSYFLGVMETTSSGWAIPTATDIVFARMVGRYIFGKNHPAVAFLMLLAIADDAIGLVILAIFYPSAELQLEWLWLSVGAVFLVFVFFNWLPRQCDRGKQDRPNSTFVRLNFGVWPYAIAGAFSWYGFQQSGLHPALGLLPIIPAIPHAERDFGIFRHLEGDLHDLLNEAEHSLKHIVALTLGLFGLMNAGIVFSSFSEVTWLVLGGLIFGKSVFVFVFGWLSAQVFGMPDGMKKRDLFVVGCISSIGFTVALFVAGVAFDSGPVQDAAKMGAFLSLFAALISVGAGKLLRVEKVV